MLTIPLRFSIRSSTRFLINMHLSKNYQSKRKNSKINLGSLLEYLIQLKIKNRLYRKVIRAKDPMRITSLRNKFKLYRNKLD